MVGDMEMTNLKEKLELSTWLHGQGFEPDMKTGLSDGDKEQRLFVLYDTELIAYCAECGNGQHVPTQAPYFTLERCLELLPERIEKKNYITIEASPEYIEPYPGYEEADGTDKEDWDQMQKEWNAAHIEDVVFYPCKNDLNYHYYDPMGSRGTLFDEQDLSDYHLAALRLLKQVVEKGYLKG